jgi:CheY-like chemotaxis protein
MIERPPTVLLVDDEDDVLEEMVTSLGYATARTRNDAEGLAAARDGTPDVVLLDIMMPGRSTMSAR